jgi:hypothetical protein
VGYSASIATRAKESIVFLGEEIKLRHFSPNLATSPKESNVCLQTSKEKLTPNPVF